MANQASIFYIKDHAAYRAVDPTIQTWSFGVSSIRALLTGTWPLFGLTITTPRLVLKLPTDRDLIALVKVAQEGVHIPGFVPMGDWTYQPSPKLERSVMQHHWHKRAEWKPEKWSLAMGVFLDGQIIGCQDIFAKNFTSLRSASTGSWIGLKYQGHGYGTEMRQAMAWFAFQKLQAREIWSGYWHDNEPSKAVSRKLGYEVIYDRLENRHQPNKPKDEPDEMLEVRLKPQHWNRPEYPIGVEGYESCSEIFGL